MGLFPISASQLLREAAAGLELLFLKSIWPLEIGFFDRKSPARSLLCVHTFFSEKAGDALVNPHPVTGLIFPPKKTTARQKSVRTQPLQDLQRDFKYIPVNLRD